MTHITTKKLILYCFFLLTGTAIWPKMKGILSRNWPHPNLWLETWSYSGTCTWILITLVLTLQIWQTGKNFWKKRENLLSLLTFSKIWQLITQVCTLVCNIYPLNFFEAGNACPHKFGPVKSCRYYIFYKVSDIKENKLFVWYLPTGHLRNVVN